MNRALFSKNSIQVATMVVSLLIGLGLGVLLTQTKRLWGRVPQAPQVRYSETGDPQAPYRLAPQQKVFLDQWTLTTNARGDRESKELQELDPNCNATLVVGSSQSLGYGVPENQRFSNRLYSFFPEKKAECHQVYNASQEGIPWTSKIFLAESVLRSAPVNFTRVILDLTTFDWNPQMLNIEGRPKLDPMNPGTHREVHRKGILQVPWINRVPTEGGSAPRGPMEVAPPWLPLAWRQHWPRGPECQGERCLSLEVSGLGPDGKRWPLRYRSGVYFSPKYVSLMVGAMQRMNEICRERSITCQVIEFDASVDDLKNVASVFMSFPSLPNLNFISLEQYAQSSYADLERRVGLGDGFHFNPRGHDLVLQALKDSAEPDSEENQNFAWEIYLSERRKSDIAFIESIESFVESTNEINMHQLVSPRDPWYALGPEIQSQEVLLGRAQSSRVVRARGIFGGIGKVTLSLKVWPGGRDPMEVKQETGSGDWILEVPLSQSAPLLHVQVTCLSERDRCQQVRWSRIETL